MRLSCRETAQIAEIMARARKAATPAGRMFEILLRRRRGRARRAIEEIRRRVGEGRTFHEGFAACPDVWPRYLIELVRSSERAGMLAEGLSEGADYFRKMGRTLHTVHMLWVAPAIIILFGWLIRLLIRLHFLGMDNALAFGRRGINGVVPLLALIALVVYVRPVRRLFDRILLHLPLVAETVRDLSLYQFTTCFRYLYSGAVTGAEIVCLAAGAMSNRYLAEKAASAGGHVREGFKFSEALGMTQIIWPDDFIGRLSQGEYAGQLDPTLKALAGERKEALENRVEAARGVLQPLAGYLAQFAIAMEIYAIFKALQNR